MDEQGTTLDGARTDDATATFAGVWERAVAGRSGAPFLRFEAPDGTITEWTYGEFDTEVAAVADRLVALGAGHGSAVHLALTNSPSFVAVWFAAMRLGAWIVPSDPSATTPELVEHLTRTGAVVGFCGTARAAVYHAAAEQVPGLVAVEVDESSGPIDLTGWPTAPPGAAAAPADATTSAAAPAGATASGLQHRADVTGSAAETRHDGGPRTAPGALDRAAVMFTSGTTGRPKGVEITQANYAFAGRVMAEAAGMGPDDRALVVLPLFHANAQYYSFAAAVSVGASVALVHAFSASGFLAQSARHGATHASLFAGPMRMVLARGAPLEDPTALRLRHCWFAQNVTDDQLDTLTEWLGCRPRQLYGMTETIPAVLTEPAADPRPDAMGRPTAGCEVDLHDAEGHRVPAGEVGEVVVAGRPGIELFAGYLDDPDTTAASYRGRWFRTGDRARRDHTERYTFDGRRADLLKVAGENVSVVEVEAVLAAHPDVLEAVVVGAPDPVRDEVPVAFVVPTAPVDDAGRETLSATLALWCEERLAKSKRPRAITVLDELPRTSVGKIRKFLLKEEATR